MIANALRAELLGHAVRATVGREESKQNWIQVSGLKGEASPSMI